MKTLALKILRSASVASVSTIMFDSTVKITLKRLVAAGFKVTTFDAAKELPAESFSKYALPKREMLYVCTK